jgi:hypothetical protein
MPESAGARSAICSTSPIGFHIGAEVRCDIPRDTSYMAELPLGDKVELIHRTLDAAGIAHALGGALALAYYGEPRATIDADINVFVDPAEYTRVLALLEPLGITDAPSADVVMRDGQCRLSWGRNMIDLFFAYDGVHEAMRNWARPVPFGDETIPILAPEHLIVAKVVFNRAKDWLDLEQMLVAVPALDFAEIEKWLDHLIGADDERARRFNDLRDRLR